MQTIILILILGIAIGYAIYSLIKNIRGKNNCSCCDNCSTCKQKTEEDEKKKEK